MRETKIPRRCPRKPKPAPKLASGADAINAVLAAAPDERTRQWVARLLGVATDDAKAAS